MRPALGKTCDIGAGGDLVIDSSLEDDGDEVDALLARCAKSNLPLTAEAISSSVEGGLLGGDTEPPLLSNALVLRTCEKADLASPPVPPPAAAAAAAAANWWLRWSWCCTAAAWGMWAARRAAG